MKILRTPVHNPEWKEGRNGVSGTFEMRIESWNNRLIFKTNLGHGLLWQLTVLWRRRERWREPAHKMKKKMMMMFVLKRREGAQWIKYDREVKEGGTNSKRKSKSSEYKECNSPDFRTSIDGLLNWTIVAIHRPLAHNANASHGSKHWEVADHPYYSWC